MSQRQTAEPTTDWGGRYGAFPLEGDVVIYDRENPDAWVQAADRATLPRDDLR